MSWEWITDEPMVDRRGLYFQILESMSTGVRLTVGTVLFVGVMVAVGLSVPTVVDLAEQWFEPHTAGLAGMMFFVGGIAAFFGVIMVLNGLDSMRNLLARRRLGKVRVDARAVEDDPNELCVSVEIPKLDDAGVRQVAVVAETGPVYLMALRDERGGEAPASWKERKSVEFDDGEESEADSVKLRFDVGEPLERLKEVKLELTVEINRGEGFDWYATVGVWGQRAA